MLRKFGVSVINQLPMWLKWNLYKSNYFNQRLRLNLGKIRSHLLCESSKIILIGANDGLSFDNLFQSLNPKLVSGLVLEPSEKYFSSLQINLKDFSKLKLLNLAATKTDRKIQLFQLGESGLNKLPDWGRGLGSISKEHLLQNSEIDESDIEVIEVRGVNLMTLLQKYSEFSKIDYFQIDTEGHDAEILSSINFNFFEFSMIKFEWVNLSSDDHLTCSKLLENRGFVLTLEGGDCLGLSKSVNPYFK